MIDDEESDFRQIAGSEAEENMMRRAVSAALMLGVLTGGLVGCETKAGTGAIVGGAGGAAAGGVIGSMSHARSGEGAIIGAAVGAIGGAFIGHGMDKADEKKAVPPPHYASTEYDRRHVVKVEGVNKTDVIEWSHRGVSEDVMIDRIERSGTIFRLTAADENRLRDEGVSESVIRAMRDSGRR